MVGQLSCWADILVILVTNRTGVIIEVLLVDFPLYDEFRTRLGVPWVYLGYCLRLHEVVTLSAKLVFSY